MTVSPVHNPPSDVLLKTDALGIAFGGHKAVDSVSAEFRRGTLTAIVGPNGAGKTTYFNLISGQLKASTGRIWLDGEEITRLPASARARRGLGRAFQLTNLFPKLSALENVRLVVQSAEAGRHHRGMNLWDRWMSFSGLTSTALEVLASVAMEHRRDTPVSDLSHGDQRKLEVALMIAMRPKVFMFDEPTAGMSADEVPVILNHIRKLKADPAKAIVLVEHKMDVIRELADRIIVLHNGQLVADGDPTTVMNSPIVQMAYLGKTGSEAG